MVLSVLQAAFAALIIPRFATLNTGHRRLVTRFLQAQALVTGIGVLVTGAVWLFPSHALRVIGPNYLGLEHEIVLATAGASLSLVASVVYALNAARGRVPPAYVYPLTGIATTIVLVLLIDMSTVRGAMLFGLLGTLSALVVGNIVFLSARETPRSVSQ
jgi:hypothetical protein